MADIQVPTLPNGAPADESRAAATQVVNELAAKFFGSQQVPPAPQQVSVADRYAEKTDVPDLSVPDIPPERTDIALPQDGDQGAVGRAFAASRAEARQYRQLAEQLKAKLLDAGRIKDESSSKVAELTEELTAGQDRIKALENEIGQLDLQRSPEFVARYDTPIADVRDQIADQLVRGSGMTQSEASQLAFDIIDARTSEDAQNLVADLPVAVQGMALYKYAEADKLLRERAEALDEWRTTQAGLAQVSQREAPVLDAEHRQKMCDTGFGRVAKVVQFWDDPAFVEWRASEADKVKAWFSRAPEDQVVTAAIEGALVAPFAYAQIAQLQEKLAQAQHALEARSRVSSPPISPYFWSAPVAPPPAPPAATAQQATEDSQDPMDYAKSLIADTASRYGLQMP